MSRRPDDPAPATSRPPAERARIAASPANAWLTRDRLLPEALDEPGARVLPAKRPGRRPGRPRAAE